MSMGASSPGFLLLDGNAGIIGYNEEAVRILMYPTASKRPPAESRWVIVRLKVAGCG